MPAASEEWQHEEQYNVDNWKQHDSQAKHEEANAEDLQHESVVVDSTSHDAKFDDEDEAGLAVEEQDAVGCVEGLGVVEEEEELLFQIWEKAHH